MRVLVSGAQGFLGSHIVGHMRTLGHTVVPAVRSPTGAEDHAAVPLDLLDLPSITAAVERANPDAVVHAAAIADIRRCEADPATASRINVDGTAALAAACRSAGARLVFLSTDQVFDGEHAPYSEAAQPSPLHCYGRTKALAEQAVAATGDGAIVLRLALTFGPSPSGERSSSDQVLRALERGGRPQLFLDEFRSPVHARDIASAIAELIEAPAPPPLLHLGGPARVSRYDLGIAIARARGLDPARFDPIHRRDFQATPPRPRDLTLDIALARRVLRRPPRPLEEGMDAL